jgi:hypothetical protein
VYVVGVAVPCAGGVTISYVRFALAVSTSLTSASRFSVSGVSSFVVRVAELAIGVSLTGSTVIETVAGADTCVPSLAV